MSLSELNELTKAEQLFDDGKFDEALELLKELSQNKVLNLQQKDRIQYLKGLILFYQNKSGELIKLGEQMFKESQKPSEKLSSIDGLYFMAMGLGTEKKFDLAFDRIKQAKDLLISTSNLTKSVITLQKFRLNVTKSWLNMHVGKIDLAEKCLKELLQSQGDLGNIWEELYANSLIAYIQLQARGRYDLSLDYTKKSMSLAKKLRFNHFWLGACHLSFGAVYLAKCEYELSIEHHMKSLAYFKLINNKWYLANTLNNLGVLHHQKGENTIAMKYLEEALVIWEPFQLFKEWCLDNLIFVALEKGDINQAKRYFQHLEDLYSEKKDPPLEAIYLFNKALLLKASSRIRDKAKSEEIFKHLTKAVPYYFSMTIQAYINLCDLLLAEYRINNNSEVLAEIKQNIDKLLSLAEKSHSYAVFCNTFILQAKLALLNFDMKAARRFLTQAQKIAESHGITRIAMKISHEHDELIKQSQMWEDFKDTDMSLADRWKIAGLSEQMEKMVKKRMIEVPEISKEEPVLLLIVSEGGVPFFSHSFIEDKSFESHLFGGFLSTIDYFINEVFSEGLDRAVFGEHTLLMESIPPFFISYIFKGDSYYALQKLDYFKDRLQKEGEIWQNLLRNFHKNTTFQLKDEPLLESLITNTFIANNLISR